MTHETYARAEALLAGNERRLIVGGEATATFLPGSDRFRLVERLDEGERVQLVDPDEGTLVGLPRAALIGEEPPQYRIARGSLVKHELPF